jgi:hypothetical protein
VSITQILHLFAGDSQLKAVAVLIAADLILGIIAAVSMHTFRLTYISNFLRNDVLGKVLPWFALFALGKTSTASVAGVDFGTIADGAWIVALGALLGSLSSSLSDLGLPIPPAIGGHAPPPTQP